MPTLYWPAEAWRALAATVPVTARSATAPTVSRAIVRRRRICLFLRIRNDTPPLNMRGDSGVSVMPVQAAAVKGEGPAGGDFAVRELFGTLEAARADGRAPSARV